MLALKKYKINKMNKLYSPLRYPGGKAKLVPFFKKLIEENDLKGTTYIEPFAGGANVALSLLIDGYVSNIIINDIDKSIYAFWKNILTHTNEFIEKIQSCSLTIKEWKKQKKILENPENFSEIERAFALFFLNRTNFSGVIHAGPIGGLAQTGKYKLNARFNKKNLIQKIQQIAAYKENITVICKDALDVIEMAKNMSNCLIYLDPPYYVQGKRLYMNFYNHANHSILANRVRELKNPLVITYDNVDAIKELYQNLEMKEFIINYSAKTHTVASEVMFWKNLPSLSRSFLQILAKSH